MFWTAEAQAFARAKALNFPRLANLGLTKRLKRQARGGCGLWPRGFIGQGPSTVPDPEARPPRQGFPIVRALVVIRHLGNGLSRAKHTIKPDPQGEWADAGFTLRGQEWRFGIGGPHSGFRYSVEHCVDVAARAGFVRRASLFSALGR